MKFLFLLFFLSCNKKDPMLKKYLNTVCYRMCKVIEVTKTIETKRGRRFSSIDSYCKFYAKTHPQCERYIDQKDKLIKVN